MPNLTPTKSSSNPNPQEKHTTVSIFLTLGESTLA